MDEDGRFTELAGAELQDLAVMSEGTDKGTSFTYCMNINASCPLFSSELLCSSSPGCCQ